jgi:lipopolysaccharide export LptBFGC system permease protein LptF
VCSSDLDDGAPLFSISAEKASFYVDQKQGLIVLTFYDGNATVFATDKQREELPAKFERLEKPWPLDWLKRSKTDIRDLSTPELWVYSQSLRGGDRRKAEAEATERPALSLACFAFVFIGVPLGIRTRSRHLLSAFALACLPVYVFYFPLLIMGGQAAERGWGPPGALLWFPDALLLALGAVLLAVEFRR